MNNYRILVLGGGILAWSVGAFSTQAASHQSLQSPDIEKTESHHKEQNRLLATRTESAPTFIGRVEEVRPDGLVVNCGEDTPGSSWFRKFLSGHPKHQEYAKGDLIKFRAFRDGDYRYQGLNGQSRALMLFTYCGDGASVEDRITIDKPTIIQKARDAALAEIEKEPDIEFSFHSLAYTMEPDSEGVITVVFRGLESEETEQDAGKVTTRMTFKAIVVNMDEQGQVTKVRQSTPSQTIRTTTN